MPNIKSAKKALRQSKKRRTRNLRGKKAAKDAIKQLEMLAQSGKHADAATRLPGAYKAIDKAAKRGIFKKNTAARKKSRLARLVSAPSAQ